MITILLRLQVDDSPFPGYRDELVSESWTGPWPVRLTRRLQPESGSVLVGLGFSLPEIAHASAAAAPTSRLRRSDGAMASPGPCLPAPDPPNHLHRADSRDSESCVTVTRTQRLRSRLTRDTDAAATIHDNWQVARLVTRLLALDSVASSHLHIGPAMKLAIIMNTIQWHPLDILKYCLVY
jgi:hypothetical protein